MSLIDVRTTRVLFTLLLFALGLGFLYVAHHTLIAFLFAIFFAYLVDPAISRVEKWTRSRGLAIAAVYLLMVSVLATFFFFVGPSIAHQAQRLSESLPALLEKVGSGQIAEDIGQQHGWSKTRDINCNFWSAIDSRCFDWHSAPACVLLKSRRMHGF